MCYRIVVHEFVLFETQPSATRLKKLSKWKNPKFLATMNKWHNFCHMLNLKNIQHGGTWLCFKQYKLMHDHSFTRISIFRFIRNFNVPPFSTVKCMLTWGEIGVACYLWMALYQPGGVVCCKTSAIMKGLLHVYIIHL